jgi:hypothetical protein
MSGPKVFQIVPLQEARRSWHVWLLKAGSRLEHWVSSCHRIGMWSELEEKEQRARLARVRRLVETDTFDGVIAEGLSFLKHLDADLAARLDEAASRNLTRQRALSSAGTTARVLLKMARESAVHLPEQTAALLRQAADRGVENLSAVEEAILSAARLMQPVASSAAAMCEGPASRIELVDDWLRRTGYLSPPSMKEVQRQSVERLLCELTGLGCLLEVETFRKRLADVCGQSVQAQRVLALEVLCQELQRKVEEAQRWGELRQRADDLRAEAEQTGDLNVLQDCISTYELAFERRDEASASAALEVQRGTLNTAIALRNAEIRRSELLRGLTQLGYTVNAGLSKIWSAQKQVVIRKSVQSATGLELSGDLATGKCQVRVVSLEGGTAGQTPINGRKAEEQWCSELSELQRDLGRRGVSLVVERATPAGAVALKPATCTWVSDFAGAEETVDEVQGVKWERQR